jgi:predicted nuclease with TOPRIM domain
MNDAPANLILDHLRAIRGELTELRTDMIKVKERLGLIENQCASASRRLDRVAGDVELLKRRLNLVEV